VLLTAGHSALELGAILLRQLVALLHKSGPLAEEPMGLVECGVVLWGERFEKSPLSLLLTDRVWRELEEFGNLEIPDTRSFSWAR